MGEGLNVLFDALDEEPQRHRTEPAADEVPSG
jgi:hypothetical protein